jgi:hypothetical protein
MNGEKTPNAARFPLAPLRLEERIREAFAEPAESVTPAQFGKRVKAIADGWASRQAVDNPGRGTKAGEIPYFSRRKPSVAFKRLDQSGKTGGGVPTAP